jgi:hypothetical protein
MRWRHRSEGMMLDIEPVRMLGGKVVHVCVAD